MASTALRRFLSRNSLQHHPLPPSSSVLLQSSSSSSWIIASSPSPPADATTTSSATAAGGAAGITAILSAVAASVVAASVLESHWSPTSRSSPDVTGDPSSTSSSKLSRRWSFLLRSSVAAARCEAAAVRGSGEVNDEFSPAPAAATAASLLKRMTLIGRFSMESESLANPSITSFFMSLSGNKKSDGGTEPSAAEPLTVGSLVQLWKDRNISERHPRFFQVVSPLRQGYFEPSPKALEHYITEVLHPAATAAPFVGTSDGDNSKGKSVRRDIQRRIALLQTSPWDLNDALWHLYVAPGRAAHDANRYRPAFPSTTSNSSSRGAHDGADDRSNSYVFFRAHHALADGASMVAAMMDLFDEADAFRSSTEKMVVQHRRRGARGSWLQRLWRRVLRLLWFLRGSIRGIWYQCRLFIFSAIEPNPWHIVRHHSSSKAASASTSKTTSRVVSFVDAAAPVDQVKRVARHVAGPRATVNDVFVSCITSALAKQLEQHRQRIRAQHGTDIPIQEHGNVSVPVHLSGGVILPGESLGNRLGAFVVRLPIEASATEDAGNDDLRISEQRLRDVHHQMLYVKQTSTPLLSHWLAKGLSVASHVLPSSWISYLYSKSNADSVAVVTNVRGPPHAVHLGGRKVESFHGFIPLPPGVPVGVVVSSYDNKMTLTLSAEPWAVPDGDQFLAWVLEEYLRLVKAAGA